MMEKLKTKKEEKRFTTSIIEEMQGMFLAKRLLRTWNEDFVDEDTGETVSIERNEIILDRGTLLDSGNLQTIQFHLTSGDINEVEVTDIQRQGVFHETYFTNTWSVTAVISGKKKNIYLYANSVFMALEIAKDYIEQAFPGGFGITGVKEQDNAILVTNISSTENDGEFKFYKIEVEIEDGDDVRNSSFIVKGMDAENSKAIVEAYISKKLKEKGEESELIVTLQSAKIVPCEAVIDPDFCEKYKENGEE